MSKQEGAPHDFHNRIVRRVKKKLGSLGYEIEVPNGRGNSCCCCDLRVSNNGNRARRVTVKAVTMKEYINSQKNRNGTARRYKYRAAKTTLHDCRLSRRPAAEVAIICVVEDNRIIAMYVIPWRELKRRRSVFIQWNETIGNLRWYDRYYETWSFLD